MRRGRLAWGMALALSVVGWLSAHALAYHVVAPDQHERVHLLAASGHSYLPYVPFVVALCFAVVVVCLAALVATGVSGSRRPTSLASLGVVPLLAFAAQEHLEHFLHQGGHLHLVAAEPTFVVGLLLQLPFAVAAVFVGRALLGFAAALARRLGGDRRRERVVAPRSFEPALGGDIPRVAALAFAHAPRAPPHLLSR